MLIDTETPEPEIVYHDVFFGEMHWQLTFFDHGQQIAVYETYRFKEEIEQEKIDRGEIRIFLRNIGYQGIISVLTDREGATLNSPKGVFPVTTASTNYNWIYDAHFPNAPATVPYGHHVFAIFSRERLRFRPVIRAGILTDPYFLGKEIHEFYTEDPISFRDALLLTSEADFETLVSKGADSRQSGLLVLGRSEAEQQEWENRVLEEAMNALGRAIHPHDLRGVALTPVYTLLLKVRADSTISKGMLFHLRSPNTRQVLLTGEFVSWAKDQQAGAMPLTRVNDKDWVTVVSAGVAPARRMPYSFKFIVERENCSTWANGLYLVDNHDPYRNSLATISGQETFYSKERAAGRLEVVHHGS